MSDKKKKVVFPSLKKEKVEKTDSSASKTDKVDFSALKQKATERVASIDKADVMGKAQKAGEALGNKADEIKDSAMAVKEDIEAKLKELDRMLDSSITEYNDAFTIMNDRGLQLFVERSRAVDSIDFVGNLINSIANRPKSFDTEFEEIKEKRKVFLNSRDFGELELKAAREAAGGAGAGLAAGASVACMGPTAAMWVATTFGTASTGTAISTLSGVAAQNAALAWLGGGALSAGGGGMAAGNALLAMAGPIGWSIAGATLLTSILLFSKKKMKLNKQKNEEIESVKRNTETVKEIDLKIHEILSQTNSIREGLNSSYMKCMELFGKDYMSFNDNQKKSLGALVNQAKALSAMFEKTVR